MTTSARTVAVRRGILVVFGLAAGLLAAPPVPAQAVAAPAVSRTVSPAAGAVSTAKAVPRPRNGTILYSGIRGGLGKLTIKNGPGQDGVVTLMQGKSKAISVYVRARSSTTVSDITEGTYTVYYTAGSGFDVSKRRFTRGATYWKFDTRLVYVPPPDYNVWTLTLYVVKGGNAPTKQIPPKSYPA
jgi:hypothetical protein